MRCRRKDSTCGQHTSIEDFLWFFFVTFVVSFSVITTIRFAINRGSRIHP